MAKYDSLRKLQRNKELVEYAEAHPEQTLEEIGAAFGGLTHQRVSKLLIQNGAARSNRSSTERGSGDGT